MHHGGDHGFPKRTSKLTTPPFDRTINKGDVDECIGIKHAAALVPLWESFVPFWRIPSSCLEGLKGKKQNHGLLTTTWYNYYSFLSSTFSHRTLHASYSKSDVLKWWGYGGTGSDSMWFGSLLGVSAIYCQNVVLGIAKILSCESLIGEANNVVWKRRGLRSRTQKLTISKT